MPAPAGLSRAKHAIGVVVPAHDEEEALAACLAAIRAAADAVSVPVEVVVVLDACTDGSAAVAAAAGVHVRTIAARNVGAARHVGFSALLDLGLAPVAAVWLATTDADTLVPVNWLSRQLAYAAAGWDAVLGTVQVRDWSDHSVATRTAYELLYEYGDGHPHVHGANLGLSASAYLEVGGFPALALAEDEALIGALAARGRRIRRAGDLPVVTSARLRPRAAGGFGDLLRSLSA